MLIAVLVGVYLLLPQLGDFKTTYTVLRHALWGWVLIGLVAAALSFLAGAVTQFAAGNFTGKLSDIVIIQFAGSFINHFLPFSVGGVNLTAQYYQKHGRRQAESITMASIPIIFGVITTVIIVAIVSPITLTHFLGRLHPSHFNMWVVGPFIAAAVVGAMTISRFWKRVKELLIETLTGLKGVVELRRLAILTAGSIGITASMSLALLASIHAVHGSIALVAVFVIYVTSSLVSNIAPTPGGIGATEAVIVIGLVAAHLHLPEAAASTVIFRLLTFWLPFIPGSMALRYLKKSKTV